MWLLLTDKLLTGAVRPPSGRALHVGCIRRRAGRLLHNDKELQPMRNRLIAPVIALALAAAAVPALADTRIHVPRDQWLSPSQVIDKLTSAGYRVTEIETDDGVYEVDLVDKNGVRIEAHVHPATGEIL